MISVLDNINTVNYIIQNCVEAGRTKPLREMNAFHTGDGYAMDISTGKANTMLLLVRTSTLQNLCKITFTPTQMLVRYGPKFMFLYNKKTNLFTTNLFDEAFQLDEMEAMFFTQNLVVDWGLQVDFDCAIMADTLTKCWSLYNDFLVSIKK